MEDQVVAVRSGVAELRLDLGAVHDARVALRHLRATLTTFAPVLDDVPADLAGDARQVAATRDAEVVAERLETRLEKADPGPARVLEQHLATWAVEASETARAAMSDPRTVGLLEALGRLHLVVPSTPEIYVDLRAQRLVVRALEDLCDGMAMALADEVGSRSRRARRLHACRKQVKTARAVLPVLETGREERARLAKSLRRLQDLLGDHHDAHVTRTWLAVMAGREPAAEELVRSLRAEELVELETAEAQLPRAVERLVGRVEHVRRTPGVHLPSP